METETTNGIAILWSLYDAAVPVVSVAVLWLGARLSGFIKAKTKNELVEGVLLRLEQSVLDAVTAVAQEMAPLIEKARKPGSPGGGRLTKSEAEFLKKTAVSYVKSYWGEKGLLELAKILGLSSFFEPKSSVLNKVYSVISTKIESTIDGLKKGLIRR